MMTASNNPEPVGAADVNVNAKVAPGEVEVAAPAVFKAMKDRQTAHLAWHNIGFSVKAAGGRKELLKGVSGELKPGSLTCILGPSGSGKTTLLNILSGRVGSGGRFSSTLSGDFTVNGCTMTPMQHQHLFAYVMQEDALFATETPKEVLTMAAKLKLQGVAEKEIERVVEDMIDSLGLRECMDTLCGNENIKGISGGQKKRTSIGAELITNPSITFLDEPTSGLDSSAAYNVIEVLRALAAANQAVMCTIHQPSSEIFHKFDNAIFLAKGSVIYQGPPSGIRAYFTKLGHECPEDYNPADFVMFLIQRSSEEELSRLSAAWRSEYRAPDAPKEQDTNLSDLFPKKKASKGWFVQFKALAARQSRNLVRDKASLIGRFGISAVLSTVVSLIFYDIGNLHADDYTVQSHTGAITFAAINAMMSTVQPTLLTFPFERPVFLREKFAGMYGAGAYMLSKTMVEVLLVICQSVVVVTINYFLMSWHGNFGMHIVGFTALGLATSSVGLLMGCAVTDIKTAMELAPAVLVPQILFAGFFIRIEQIPVVLRWLQYLCSLKWGINVILVNELDVDDTTGPKGKWGEVLDENDVDPDLYAVYFVILLGIFAFCRVVGAVLLNYKAKALYS
mmetsp:Transcript_21903/g.51184  ORF Transcript_21903/g.51184 Transcript_21903/m.51184 type:complete len:621 (-) Transcript_21903:96-1958(-)